MKLGFHGVRTHWIRGSWRSAAGGGCSTRLVREPAHRQYHQHRTEGASSCIILRMANSCPQPNPWDEVIHRGSARTAPSYALRHGEGDRWRRATGNPRRIDMSQGAFVTLVGYVAQEPNIRTTRTGKTVTDLRVGITPRYLDRPPGSGATRSPRTLLSAAGTGWPITCAPACTKVSQSWSGASSRPAPTRTRTAVPDRYAYHREHRRTRPEPGYRQLHQASVQAAARGRRPGERPDRRRRQVS